MKTNLVEQTTRGTLLAALVAVLALVAGCEKGSDSEEEGGDGVPPSGAAALPGTKEVEVEVSGQGYTREAAVDDALAMAVAQVNGKTFAGGDASKVRGAIKQFDILDEEEVMRKIPERRDGVSVTAKDSSSGSFSASGSASADASVTGYGSASYAAAEAYSASGEAKSESSVEVVRESKGKERVWQVKVKAVVLQFDGGAEAGKPRIVIADPKTSSSYYQVGDTRLSAAEISDRIRRMISEDISQTSRFQVIDRGFEDELDAELSNALGANANPNDIVRLGQRITADILIAPVIEYFEYRKSVRTLKLSGRELISYSGGFKGSVAVLNVATGQLLFTESFSVDFPTTEPRAFGPGVDALGVSDKAIDGLVTKFVENLTRRTFPVSVISLAGTSAVLNQGGTMLKQGSTYEIVRMGKEMFDPQTKRSLGRMEEPFGTIRITRVDPSMSYGDLALKGAIADSDFKPGMLEVRQELRVVEVATPSASAEASASSASASAQSSARKKKSKEDEDLDDFLNE